MADVASIGHLGPPQMVVGHLRPAAIWDFYKLLYRINVNFAIGSSKEHTNHGCEMCGSDKYCEPQSYEYECRCLWHEAQRKLSLQTTELAVRKKALEVPDFPSRKVWYYRNGNKYSVGVSELN